jgi:hypothetical protein
MYAGTSRPILRALAAVAIVTGLNSSYAHAQTPLPQKLEQIDRTFICPETLANDEARQDALKLFIDQLQGIQSNLTVRKIVTYRVAMLRKHQCNTTLAHLGIATANSPQPAASTVRAFYEALGAGQGAAASAMVVPEKREKPAFSPTAMTRFYSSLRQPIRLIDISGRGSGAYIVHYRYGTSTRACDGRAFVAITIRGGQNFIQSISPLNGC